MKRFVLFALVLGLVAGSTPAHAAAMVGYYPFNGNANDESGNGNNGTVHGATLTPDCPGVPDRAYDFDGLSSYIEVADSPSLRPSSLTVACCFLVRTLDDPSGGDNLVCKQYGPLNSFCLYIGSSSTSPDYHRVTIVLNGGFEGDDIKLIAPAELSLGVWHHAAATYDGSTIILYVDGVEVNRVSYSTPIEYCDGPMCSMVFGGIHWYSQPGLIQLLDGKMDEVRIYDYALDASSIGALAASGSQCPVPTEEKTWGQIKNHYR